LHGAPPFNANKLTKHLLDIKLISIIFYDYFFDLYIVPGYDIVTFIYFIFYNIFIKQDV